MLFVACFTYTCPVDGNISVKTKIGFETLSDLATTPTFPINTPNFLKVGHSRSVFQQNVTFLRA